LVASFDHSHGVFGYINNVFGFVVNVGNLLALGKNIEMITNTTNNEDIQCNWDRYGIHTTNTCSLAIAESLRILIYRTVQYSTLQRNLAFVIITMTCKRK
jgi:hypothetical protein